MMNHLINAEDEFKWTVTKVLWGDYTIQFTGLIPVGMKKVQPASSVMR